MFKIKLKKYKSYIVLAIVTALIMAAVDYLFLNYNFHLRLLKRPQPAAVQSSTSLADLAKQVVTECSGASYKPGCYEAKIPALMKQVSMVDAFKVTQIVQQDDPSYTYCHVLGHKLAQDEVAKDPSKWLDVVDMCPSGVCSNGCIHGAFQERFNEQQLAPDELSSFIPQIQDVCEKRSGWDPTGLEQGTCYHALGHLLMYVTDADIRSAVNVCDQVAIKDNGQRDYRKLCYDGAYMQLFQPLDSDDQALVAGKVPAKNQLASFCAKFSTMKEVSCWDEGWPLYHDEIMTPKGVVAFCQHLKSVDNQNICYTDLFYVVTAEVQLNTDFMQTYCSALPSSISGRCFANTASRLIETDYTNIQRAVDVCNSAPSAADQSSCNQEMVLYSTFNFHPGSSQFFQLCNALSEPWKGQCLSGSKT